MLASKRTQSDAELLRQLILDALGESGEQREPELTPIGVSPKQSELERITVRLPRFLMEEVKDRAKMKGMASSRWISSLVQSNLMRQPVLVEEQVLMLEASNRELAALGRNLNQIAKALNVAFHETDKLKLEHLSSLKEAINTNRETIKELVRASRGVWGKPD